MVGYSGKRLNCARMEMRRCMDRQVIDVECLCQGKWVDQHSKLIAQVEEERRVEGVLLQRIRTKMDRIRERQYRLNPESAIRMKDHYQGRFQQYSKVQFPALLM